MTIKMSDVKDKEDDDYAALEKLTNRIDQLAPMARLKDRDDEAKVRFLSSAVNGTPRDYRHFSNYRPKLHTRG